MTYFAYKELDFYGYFVTEINGVAEEWNLTFWELIEHSSGERYEIGRPLGYGFTLHLIEMGNMVTIHCVSQYPRHDSNFRTIGNPLVADPQSTFHQSPFVLVFVHSTCLYCLVGNSTYFHASYLEFEPLQW